MDNDRFDLRIKCVSRSLHEELKNLADNHEMAVSTFVRPLLRNIVNSFPEHLRKESNRRKD